MSIFFVTAIATVRDDSPSIYSELRQYAKNHLIKPDIDSDDVVASVLLKQPMTAIEGESKMAGATQALNFAAGLLTPVLRDSRVRDAKGLRGLVAALATSLFELSSSFAAVMLDKARMV